MRMRGLVAVAGFSAAVLWTAAAAFAAPAQTTNLAPAFLGSANLNLGSALMSGFAQNTVSPGLGGARFEFGQAHNWDPSRNLFPLISSLNSTFLSGSNQWSSAQIAVAPGVNFGVSHLALGLPAVDNVQSGVFSQGLGVRLDPSLRSTGTTAANLNLSLTDWSEFAITASHSNGNSSLLGLTTDALKGGCCRQFCAGYFGACWFRRRLGYDACLCRRRDPARPKPNGCDERCTFRQLCDRTGAGPACSAMTPSVSPYRAHCKFTPPTVLRSSRTISRSQPHRHANPTSSLAMSPASSMAHWRFRQMPHTK